MADPGRAADHAAMNTGGTGAVPYPAATDSAGLAYSSGHDFPDLPAGADGEVADDRDFADESVVDQSWGTAWSRAAALFLICLGLAVVILVANWMLAGPGTEPGRTTAAPVTTPRPATPTSITSTPDQDERYIAALQDKGLEFGNPQTAVENGKAVCQSFAAQQTAQEIVASFKASSPKFAAHANDFVTISVHTYCPQYNTLVAGLA